MPDRPDLDAIAARCQAVCDEMARLTGNAAELRSASRSTWVAFNRRMDAESAAPTEEETSR